MVRSPEQSIASLEIESQMGKHYYRTNVPLGLVILWWGFLGICAVIYMAYDAVFKAPARQEQMQAQKQWDRNHFNGWRLQQRYPSEYDTQHGLYTDELDKQTCTTMGYPGYPACPTQQYFVNGIPQAPPITPAPPTKKH
jgi:hypothetical protein